MTREEAKSCIGTIEMLQRLAYNIHGVMDVIDADNCKKIIKALEQEPNTWSLDDAREDFTYDVYNTLDFLPTNNEANRIIDSFDRVTSGIKKEPILNKIRAEIMQLDYDTESVDYDYDDMPQTEIIHTVCREEILRIIDKYKAESEGK